MAAARPISPARSVDTSASLAATCRHHPTPSQLNSPLPASGPDPVAADFGAPDIAQGGDGNGKISLSSWAGWLRAR
uniref:Uncharacterized protein n=2 Tax=Oryza TaxID=4527 RepID=Q6H4N4_ORYSJ|nr:hypothetical protein [Oryza sativa Japonica Group]